MRLTLRSSVLSLVAVAALLLGGCNAEVSVGSKTIDEAELETAVATQLAEQLGQDPPNIDCPGDLDAEVGATTTCELTAQGEDIVYDVSVTVTAIDEETDRADFDISVADEPQGGSTDDTTGTDEEAPADEAPADDTVPDDEPADTTTP